MDKIRDEERQRDGVRRPEAASDPRAPRPSGRQVILLVDDAEVDADLYGGLLWYNGYDVVHVADGPAALARAGEIQPDLILVDVMLPGDMDGLDVARTLREQGVKAPIIALSAHSPDEFGARVAASGVDAYIEKPAGPFAVVREAMRRIGRPPPEDSGS